MNQELGAIEEGLKGAVSVLAKGGRLSVISFHSLEDSIVKRFMRDITSRPKLPAGLPDNGSGHRGAVPAGMAKPVVAGAERAES